MTIFKTGSDPDTRLLLSIISGRNIPNGLYGHVALSSGHKVYVMGGYQGSPCRGGIGYSKAVYV